MVAQAIRAGKHVLCEKPLTITAGQARTLAGLAAEHGVLLAEAMWIKFHPAIQQARQAVSTGVIGDIGYVHVAIGFPVPYDADSRYWNATNGGGALLDLGVYTLAFGPTLPRNPRPRQRLRTHRP